MLGMKYFAKVKKKWMQKMKQVNLYLLFYYYVLFSFILPTLLLNFFFFYFTFCYYLSIVAQYQNLLYIGTFFSLGRYLFIQVNEARQPH